MNKKHFCSYCNYGTDKLSSFKTHIKTKKHLINLNTKKIGSRTAPVGLPCSSHNLEIKSIIVCEYCNMTFSKKFNLSRHIGNCKLKQISQEYEKLKKEMDDKENKYTSIINEKNNIINHKNELLEAKKDHLKDMKKTISFERKLSKQQFLDKYLPDNPELNKLEDYTIIHQEYKSINTFCRDIIHFYKRKQLHIYLGDFLVGQYCKKDINEQSLFASDVSRLNFLYSSNDNTKLNNKSNKWINDKNGINIANRIIDPLLDYIHKIIVSFSKSVVIDIKSKKLNGPQSLNSATEILECEHIIALLENDQLKQDIIKHISPYFDIIKEKIIEKMNINKNILEDKK